MAKSWYLTIQFAAVTNFIDTVSDVAEARSALLAAVVATGNEVRSTVRQQAVPVLAVQTPAKAPVTVYQTCRLNVATILNDVLVIPATYVDVFAVVSDSKQPSFWSEGSGGMSAHQTRKDHPGRTRQADLSRSRPTSSPRPMSVTYH